MTELIISKVSILNGSYLINGDTSILVDSDHRYVDLVNKWLAEGNDFTEISVVMDKITARAKRDTLLNAISWRYERYAREARLGIETTDSIEALDAYAQALADVPQQTNFPTDIEWPPMP